jgi:hypothetical protein
MEADALQVVKAMQFMRRNQSRYEQLVEDTRGVLNLMRN